MKALGSGPLVQPHAKTQDSETTAAQLDQFDIDPSSLALSGPLTQIRRQVTNTGPVPQHTLDSAAGMKHFLLLLLVGLAASCSGSGAVQLNSQDSGKLQGQVRDVNPDDLGQGSMSIELGNMRLNATTCQGETLVPEYSRIGASSFLERLTSSGYTFKVLEAREDLSYVDVQTGSDTSRFRVATLPSAPEAARHLHEALLQHGQGFWGVHRSNVAVLGPPGGLEQVVDFAVASKLACWGVLTVAGRDDSFAIAGGYQEL